MIESDAALPQTPRRRLRFAFVALLVLTALDLAVSTTGLVGSPLGMWRHGQPLFELAVLGATFIQLGARRSKRELATTIVAGAALLAVRAVLAPPNGLDDLPRLLSSFGYASLAALAISALRRDARVRRDALDALQPAIIVVLAPSLAASMLGLTRTLRPSTLDAYTFLADRAFGFSPSWAFGRFLSGHPNLFGLVLGVYVAAPAALAAAYVAQARARRSAVALDVLIATLVASALALPLYVLFPVVGPVLAFPDGFPFHEPQLAAPAWILATTGEPRNCMPSLHATWALLVWWHTRGQPLGARALGAAFLVLTLVATLGLGLHYAVDLVPAVPYTAAVRALLVPGEPARSRLARAGAGFALVLGWMAMVRFGLPLLGSSVALCWGCAAATVLAGLALQRRTATLESKNVSATAPVAALG